MSYVKPNQELNTYYKYFFTKKKKMKLYLSVYNTKSNFNNRITRKQILSSSTAKIKGKAIRNCAKK